MHLMIEILANCDWLLSVLTHDSIGQIRPLAGKYLSGIINRLNIYDFYYLWYLLLDKIRWYDWEENVIWIALLSNCYCLHWYSVLIKLFALPWNISVWKRISTMPFSLPEFLNLLLEVISNFSLRLFLCNLCGWSLSRRSSCF